MFIAGLIVLSADILNTNFFNIYTRLKVQVEEKDLGTCTEITQK